VQSAFEIAAGSSAAETICAPGNTALNIDAKEQTNQKKEIQSPEGSPHPDRIPRSGRLNPQSSHDKQSNSAKFHFPHPHFSCARKLKQN